MAGRAGVQRERDLVRRLGERVENGDGVGRGRLRLERRRKTGWDAGARDGDRLHRRGRRVRHLDAERLDFRSGRLVYAERSAGDVADGDRDADQAAGRVDRADRDPVRCRLRDARDQTAKGDDCNKEDDGFPGHGVPHKWVRMAITASSTARRINAHWLSVGAWDVAMMLMAPATSRSVPLFTFSVVVPA